MKLLKEELDNKVKSLVMEIIRSCNDFQRETGLLVDSLYIPNSSRKDDGEIGRLVPTFIPYDKENA